MAFWALISFHFGLLGLHFLSFWPFVHFSGFLPFGPSFPFILAFWAFISFFLLAGAATWAPPPCKLPKTVRFLIKFKQILSAAKPAAFCNFWPFWPSFPFIWAFGPSFPFILAFWAFISFHISFHFGLLGLHFLSFWRFEPSFPFMWLFGRSFPFILAFWAFISFYFLIAGAATWAPLRKLPKTVRFQIKFKQILSAVKPAAFCNFWPFWPSCPFILAFSFPFIVAFWAFISFHFGLLGCLPGLPRAAPPCKLQKTVRFLIKFKPILSAAKPAAFCNFWPFWPSFPFILAFWAFISFHFLLAGAATWGPLHKLPKTDRFLIKFKQILSAARPDAFCNFWPFWPSFPFILAF